MPCSQVENAIHLSASAWSCAGDTFPARHIGPSSDEQAHMLKALGYTSLAQLIDATIPADIRLRDELSIDSLPEPRLPGEQELLGMLQQIASQNQVFRSMIGMGYHDTITPAVIQRNILENPGWYTQYTPYQAEISQGRLEALLNFQTMICDLTDLPLANASLLDEGTAAAEAMAMCRAIVVGEVSHDSPPVTFMAAADCHPQTLAVLRTRAQSLGIRLVVAPVDQFSFEVGGENSGGTSGGTSGDTSGGKVVGVLVQYPTTDGRVVDYSSLIQKAHAAGALVVMAADILALTMLKSPGRLGADIAVGSTQRFGVPMGFGGPHAAYMATRPQFARKMPGRLVGVSKDAQGNPAYRLAIQTREQHIRRDKATSNICTAQVLLAIMASMYAVYHGPDGLRRIAGRVHGLTVQLAKALRAGGHHLVEGAYFDTLRVTPVGRQTADVLAVLRERRINLRDFGDGSLGISLDETTTPADLADLLSCFGIRTAMELDAWQPAGVIPAELSRDSDFLTHPVFHRYHSEHEMLRYIRRLESRDLSLATSMISLGSCTMKLNGTSLMFPITWPRFARMHPFVPAEQSQGYARIVSDLGKWLAQITGMAATSLQPNAGSQGEYAGLLAILAYHRSRGQAQRRICLIPVSAHGTNPASAVIAGLEIVPVACDSNGNIDVADLQAKAQAHANDLAALMITYPSTHGVFEESVRQICQIIHQHGGQVYMDGANMNAQVGLCRPGDIGADVCHLNLHKTFCIPHGGGGPGVGPICVAAHLTPFLPDRTPQAVDPASSPVGPVSAASQGSALILVIPWVYIALMRGQGLKQATSVAILNANYMAHRLREHYPVLYTGRNGRVAHEFILDCRGLEQESGVKVEDIAKRLMDYGFHAPTMSWPVPGTLMIEPTESESLVELERFCDAMISIRAEIAEIAAGKADRQDNPLKHAPHTAMVVSADHWPHKYSRQQAAYPTPWQSEHKFWPSVGRIDNPYGDRNLVCTCPPMQ